MWPNTSHQTHQTMRKMGFNSRTSVIRDYIVHKLSETRNSRISFFASACCTALCCSLLIVLIRGLKYSKCKCHCHLLKQIFLFFLVRYDVSHLQWHPPGPIHWRAALPGASCTLQLLVTHLISFVFRVFMGFTDAVEAQQLDLLWIWRLGRFMPQHHQTASVSYALKPIYV